MNSTHIVLSSITVPALVAVVTVACLLVIRGISVHFLGKWVTCSPGTANRNIIQSFRVPSFYWCIAIGLYLAVELSELPAKYTTVVERAIYILIIFSVTTAIANLAVQAFEACIQRSDIDLPATGIILGVFKAIIIIAGILVILNVLGVSITPLLTALGVGGLAVALALKDTLANLFAGLHIIASKQVRPGDYIKLSSGEEGIVSDITWRSTTIISTANNSVIVPNAHVAAATITNYEFPDRQMSVSIQLIAPAGSDIEKIETVSCDTAARVIAKVTGAVSDHAPSLRFHSFGETGMGFSINVKITDSGALFPVRHELIKALYKRYAEEGIAIPPHVPRT